MNNKTSAYEHRTIDFVELLCLFISYSYREKFYNFKYSFHYLHAVQTKPCVNVESSESCKAVMRFSKHCKGQHKLKNMCLLPWVKSWNGIKTSCWFYSAGRESGPSSLNTAVSRASEVGVSGVSWERSSEHLLTVGEITSGLVSQDSVLCSELPVVVVVATLWGTGSNSSSSSSRMGVSWISAKETQTFQSSSLLSGLRTARNRGQSLQLTAESLWILLGNLPF